MYIPTLLLERKTNAGSKPEDILAEMDYIRKDLAYNPEALAYFLQEMEEDLELAEAFARDASEEELDAIVAKQIERIEREYVDYDKEIERAIRDYANKNQ